MSHKILNDPMFYCPKCMKHKKVELRSTLKAHRLFACIECATAVTKLLKERAKGKKK